YRLAEGIYRLARELDVEFQFGETVVDAAFESGRLTSVTTDRGGIYRADRFVSNVEVIPFYRDITDEEGSELAAYDSFEPSCSGFVLHLGVSREYPQLAHHNFFFSDDPVTHFRSVFEDYSLPQDPTIYLVATTRTDPTTAPSGHENIKILPHIPHLGGEPFSAAERGDFEDIVLDKLERMGLEGLRENTVYRDVWWPEDIRDMYRSNRGSIYGVVSDIDKNRGFKAPKKSSLYSNLFFVGGSVNPGGGMPMVTLSGQMVADMIDEVRE
ncbi:MAG: diapolycopene oxygenase, partial [Bacillota bacterium]